MAKIRISADIILDTTDKATARTIWNQLKTIQAKFKEIPQTVEKSTIIIHKCFHDEDETKPCQEIKKIVMQNTELDEVL